MKKWAELLVLRFQNHTLNEYLLLIISSAEIVWEKSKSIILKDVCFYAS